MCVIGLSVLDLSPVSHDEFLLTKLVYNLVLPYAASLGARHCVQRYSSTDALARQDSASLLADLHDATTDPSDSRHSRDALSL